MPRPVKVAPKTVKYVMKHTKSNKHSETYKTPDGVSFYLPHDDAPDPLPQITVTVTL